MDGREPWRHPLVVGRPLLELLARRLAEREPRRAEIDGNPARAAVAVLFRAPSAPEVELLLIRRAEREGDPWSGQMGLPGGRMAARDRSLLNTVLRETFEEIGLDISASGVMLGQLDELRPRTPVLPPIVVTPFVAVVPPESEAVPNEEVAEALWVPASALTAPAALGEATVQTRAGELTVPAFRVGSHVVWGMTERILSQLLQHLRSAE